MRKLGTAGRLIKEIAELQGSKLSMAEVHRLESKLASERIDGLLKESALSMAGNPAEVVNLANFATSESIPLGMLVGLVPGLGYGLWDNFLSPKAKKSDRSLLRKLLYTGAFSVGGAAVGGTGAGLLARQPYHKLYPGGLKAARTAATLREIVDLQKLRDVGKPTEEGLEP